MDERQPHPLRQAPAAIPAALFAAGIAAAQALEPVPLGLLVVGGALALALGRRASLHFAALLGGLIVATLSPPPALDGLDRGRIVEVAGEVSGFWSEEVEGSRATLARATVRQGERIWIEAPPIGVELAPGIAPPPPGSRVRVRGELRRAAGYANERATRPGRWRLRVKSARFLEVESGPGPMNRLAARLRKRIEGPFARHAPSHPGIAYAAAILFGELDPIPEREQRAFRRSGLAHLLAVSGMNVALAIGFVALPGAWFDRRIRLALLAVAVAVHLAVVGPAPSLARASAMAAIAAAALALGRAPHPLQALSIAFVGLLVADPALAGDVGFRLSCAATFGIVALAPPIAARFGEAPRLLRLAVATSLAAQMATLPISVAGFSSLSPGGLVLNLVYVPLASLLLVSAFAWAAVALALPAVAGGLALALDLVAAPFALLPHLPAGPWLTLPSEGTLFAGLAASAFLAIVSFSRLRARLLFGGCAALALTGAAAPTGDGFELLVADVGQGDGILFRNGRHAALVDGGGARGRDLAAQVWLPILARRGISRLDALVVSHGDLDHCGGLVDVAVHLRAAEIWSAPQLAGSACLRELEFWSGARVRWVAAGDRMSVGEGRFTAFAPGTAEPASDSNAVSLVLRLEAGTVSVLLTGDLDGTAERRLAARAGDALRSDLLKVGHHGSANGTGSALLERVRPRLALISAGPRNRFGHPAPEILARLGVAGATVLRTDFAGGIALSWRQSGPITIALPGSPRPPD